MACVEEGMIQASGVQEEKMASGFCGGGLFRLPPFPLLPPPPKAWRHPLISTALKNISYYLRLLSCPEHTRERRVCSVQHQEEDIMSSRGRQGRSEGRTEQALPSCSGLKVHVNTLLFSQSPKAEVLGETHEWSSSNCRRILWLCFVHSSQPWGVSLYFGVSSLCPFWAVR